MEQIEPSLYGVSTGEIVTVEIEATQVGNFATLAVDGTKIDPVPGVLPLTFRFEVTVKPGFDHFAIVSCHFPEATPEEAFFQIFVSGSDGGGRFTGVDIKKIDPSWSRDLEFQCG